jgi:hypothetical protein
MAKKLSAAQIAAAAATAAAAESAKLAAAVAAALGKASAAWAGQLDKIEANEVGNRSIMLDTLKLAAEHNAPKWEQIRERAGSRYRTDDSARNAASQWANGHKAAAVIGIQATCALIDAAAKLKGTAYTAALEALRSVIKAGKERAKAGNTSLAVGKEGKAITDAALSAAGAALAAAGNKSKSERAPKTPAGPAELSHAAFVANLLAIVQDGRKLAMPEGRTEAWSLGMNDLSKALENLQIAVRKSNAK